MLTMSQINHIKDLSNCGYRISEISEKTGADPKTIRKYLSQDDFSPEPPIVQEKPSKLDPFKLLVACKKTVKGNDNREIYLFCQFQSTDIHIVNRLRRISKKNDPPGI